MFLLCYVQSNKQPFSLATFQFSHIGVLASRRQPFRQAPSQASCPPPPHPPSGHAIGDARLE